MRKQMNRLTKRYKSGIVTLDADAFMETQEAIDREILNCYPAKKAVERLAEYEDAEENGLLVRLPCKVGDNVYVVDRRFYNDIIKCEVIEIAQDKTGMTIKTRSWDKIHNILGLLQRCDRWFDADNFGKTVFLTREEAEAALKEREDNE